MVLQKYSASDLLVKNIVVVPKDYSIKDTSKKIIDNNSSEAIIIDEKDRVVGLVTLRDIVRAVSSGVDYNIDVNKIMTKRILAVKPDIKLEDILKILAKNNISRVPVIDNNKKIIGIITEKHLIKVLPGILAYLDEIATLKEKKGEERNNNTIYTGFCDVCGNYSEELVEFNDKLVCPECLKEYYG